MRFTTWSSGALAMAVALGGATGLVLAADHREAPAVLTDPVADINDLFVWMSPDAERVFLVLTVFPGADETSAFSDAVQYVFHTESGPAYGDLRSVDRRIVCVFDAAQRVSCSVDGGPSVSGDASDPDGLSSADEALRVFAGLRNDSFFFNLSGFEAVAETVRSVAGVLDFDEAGCPQLDGATAASLGGQLVSEPDGAAGTDDFANENVLALVISIDRELLATDGDIVAAWASTHRRP